MGLQHARSGVRDQHKHWSIQTTSGGQYIYCICSYTIFRNSLIEQQRTRRAPKDNTNYAYEVQQLPSLRMTLSRSKSMREGRRALNDIINLHDQQMTTLIEIFLEKAHLYELHTVILMSLLTIERYMWYHECLNYLWWAGTRRMVSRRTSWYTLYQNLSKKTDLTTFLLPRFPMLCTVPFVLTDAAKVG